jgi:fluoroquinolone resistance protein
VRERQGWQTAIPFRGYNITMDFSKVVYYQEKLIKLSRTKEDIKSRVFEECEFSSCSFIDCRFENCKFLRCRFIECNLSAVIPMNCQFLEVEFSRCKVMGIDWTKAQRLQDLNFSECQINYSNFRLLKLPKIKMVKCEAKEVDFIETDLSEANFKKTDFEKSTFFKTNLTDADFTGATNYFIDIKTNILKRTRFSLPEALSLLNSLDIIIE